jgi:hypothetical protein
MMIPTLQVGTTMPEQRFFEAHRFLPYIFISSPRSKRRGHGTVKRFRAYIYRGAIVNVA